MQITVKLHGVFRIGRFTEELRSYPPGTCVREVVDELRFPDHLLGIVVINDVHADLDAELHEGDTLSLLPMLDGG
ncbi:hypothetical protein DESUT3_13300 [Desulfuromonas versatilis]|uniref:MoaD/ThiS family protein n=1 Tax=Desulfuromonas versatilis TaxID=2802975 RepID=A0ABM8HU65_9BACT|nr:MoaD/ThiS family protein [Desulfuromonas versatilis]BCR04261.1 hypothetical protein DESUT3_13300 [Desulfuromonas versatilis]